MAHQPKAYKKFVASAATATLVATAIVPVASAATSFKDVSKTYEEAVNYLVENDIAQGTTETTFGTTSNISRGDAAVMIANALKLDTTSAPDAGFQDVNARVAGAVNAIVEAKIASGKTATSFAPADYITRQEMAKMLANAYELTAKENANFKDVNSNWIGYVSALKEAGITLGKTDTTFAPTENLTRGEFALFVHRAEVGVDVTPATPEVVSVNATNLKQIEVKLNVALDADEVSEDNFEVKQGNTTVVVSSADLSDDGKTITITTESALQQEGSYRVFGFDLVTATGVNVASFVRDIKVSDKTAPAIVSATAETNKDKVNQFTLKFTEPVSFTAVKVEDSILGAAKVDDFTYTVYGKDLEVGKSYIAEVFGLTDLAGNKADSPVSAPIVITKDTVKPTFAVNAVGPRTFEIKFDKVMNTAVAVDAVKVKKADGSSAMLAKLPAFKSDKRTLVVELFDFPFATGKDSAVLDVTVQGLYDRVGNAVETKTTEVTVSKDVVKPALKGAKFTEANVIEVEFSEKVTGVDASDFIVNKADNTSAATVTNVEPVANSNKYKLTLNSSLKNGAYNVILKVNTVTDDSGNQNAAQTLVVTNDKETVTTAKLSAFIQATGVDTASKQFTVYYDKSDVRNGINPTTGDIYPNGADNKALYSINGALLPEGAVITFNNDVSVDEAVAGYDINGNGTVDAAVVVDTVTINLDNVAANKLVGPYAAFANGGTATIAVGGVGNVAGGTLSLTSLPVSVADQTQPTVREAFLTGTEASGNFKLVVRFSEAMSTVASADLTLAGKDVADAPATGITLGTAVIAADGLSAEIPVTDMGTAVRTKAFTLATKAVVAPATLDSADKASNKLKSLAEAINVTNFTTN